MDYPLIKPRYYRSLFKEIVDFIKKPKDLEQTDKSTRQKIYDTIGLFILKLAFLIPISVLIGFIHDPENLSKASMAERFSPMMLILVAVFILPTVEEVAFRLSLKFIPASPDLEANLLVIIFKVRLAMGIGPADFDDDARIG